MALGVNRARYFVVWVLVGGSAWMYGERMLYIALAVLTALPILSYIIATIGIMTLRLTQELPSTILKEEYGYLIVKMINPFRLPYGMVRFVFYGDDFAVVMQDSILVSVGFIKPVTHHIPFQVNYRGEYEMGIKSIQIMDLTGLFRLTRHIELPVNMHSLPRISDMNKFPIASNLLTQATSRFDIRDEDYATISDIRPYLPTDSIKRVHWKLTAKRNEWLVKNFQSNALHQVMIILDNKRMDTIYKDQIKTEDRMVEHFLGLADFCLRRGMPVEYTSGEGHKITGRNSGDFETIYLSASRLHFDEDPAQSPYSILSQALNDTTGYVNVIIMTQRLDVNLYERMMNAQHNGHHIAVIYFALPHPDEQSDEIYKLLEESNSVCFKVTEASSGF